MDTIVILIIALVFTNIITFLVFRKLYSKITHLNSLQKNQKRTVEQIIYHIKSLNEE